MKELSIEEKARNYDKAIERAKNFIENGDERERTIAESIFAGIMEESEDEKIRKWIIGVLSTYEHDRDLRNAALAWLEKQGEQINYNDELKKCKENPLYFFDKYCKIKIKEQKPSEWSEEDKETINNLIDYLENELDSSYTDLDKESFAKEIKLLKSLRPQSHWKPSDEQIEALEHSLGDYNIKIFEDRYEILKSLYNDLKKLKGE